MNILLNILDEIWLVTVAMAPYLLFGFLMAGILSVLLSKNYVRQHLGGHGWLSPLKSALIGVPMPLCSCSVIPLAAALRKHGASRGATASFLASTPQTGVDSLMITFSLLGWTFAVFRTIMAFVSGVICGAAVAAVSPREKICEESIEEQRGPTKRRSTIIRMLTYGFISLPRDMARAMLIGMVISGVISSLIPENFLSGGIGDSPVTMLLMLVIGIPIYVCSSASVPIALAFIKAGLSPGAALIFLITGPATNSATLTTLWQIIGKKQLLIFLITLASCALISGFLMNRFSPVLGVSEQFCHTEGRPGRADLFWALLLIAVMIKALVRKKIKQTGR